MLPHISANELKTKGVTAIENKMKESHSDVVITVRGKDKFVVMSIDDYQHFRELELAEAIKEAKKDIETGAVIQESIQEHIKRIKK